MLHRSSPSIITLTLLLALSAGPKSSASSLTDPILAQASPASPTYKIPDNVAKDTVAQNETTPGSTPISQSTIVPQPDWLPWLLLPLVAGLVGLLWWQKGRQRSDLHTQNPPSTPPVSPSVPSPAPLSEQAEQAEQIETDVAAAPMTFTSSEAAPAEATPESALESSPLPSPEVDSIPPAEPMPAVPTEISLEVSSEASPAAVSDRPDGPQDPLPAAGGAIAAGLGAVALGAFDRHHSRIVLAPRNATQAYVYWEAPEEHKAALRQQGGEVLKLRIYDVTGLDVAAEIDLNAQPQILELDCAEADQDRHLSIPQSDRDYIAEIGYLTSDRRWLSLARSEAIRVSGIAPGLELSSNEPVGDEPTPSPASEVSLEEVDLRGGTIAAGTGETPAPDTIPTSQIVLTARDAQDAYAYWEVPAIAKVALKQQGGENFALRIYDVTDLNWQAPASQGLETAQSVQSYPCSEVDVDRHVPIPTSDRDYVAEVGYFTADQRWLSLARSAPIRIPSASGARSAESPSELTQPAAPTIEPVTPSEAITEPIESLLIESEPVAAESAVVEEAVSEQIAESSLQPDPWFSDEVALGGAAMPGAAFLSAPSPTEYRSDEPFPDLAQSEVEAAKFDVGQFDLSDEDLASVDEGLPDLPTGYGESYITLMARDPHWVYTYWDVPSEARMSLRQQGGTRLALRFYDVTDVDLSQQNPHSLQQYYCEEFARDWYIPVPISDRDYVVEIGYIADDGRWLLLARSAPVRVPPVYPSDWFEEKFITVSWEEEIRGQTFYQLAPPNQSTSIDRSISDRILDLSESAASQRTAGSLFGSMQQTAAGSWMTPSGAGFAPVPTASGAGMSGIGLYSMSGMGMSGAGLYTASGVVSGIGLYTTSGMGLYTTSGAGMLSGIGMYTTSGMGMSGVGLYSMSGIGMSGIGMSGVGFSASMPPIRPRKFWLVADAELIIYGATEPDATVTIAGQPVKLNPDGTFRFQMMFPDGQLDYPILAVAADGEQNRAIHLKFTRETPVRRTNTKEDATDEWL